MWFVAFLTVVLAEDLVPECPESLEISPCHTSIHISCSNFNSVHHIYQTTEKLKDFKISVLYFSDLSIPEPIKSDAFAGTSLRHIDFSYSEITLESPQFIGLENHLEAISFLSCFDSADSLGTLSLGHLVKLESLFITYNLIEVLPDWWLESAPESLDAIYFYRNGLTSLGDHAFSALTSLAFMDLHGNELTSVKRSMFPIPAKKLLSLNLRDNHLSHLPTDMFTEMPNLHWVNMKNNRLTTLDRQTWSNILPRLYEMCIEYNPLRCDASMEWLRTSYAWDKDTLIQGTCDSPLNMKGKSLDKLKV